MITVVRFNWPKYAAALALASVAAFVVFRPGAHPTAALAVASAAMLGLAWSATSLAATWWVYDRSKVYERVAEGVGPAGTWGLVHAGFDGSRPALTARFGTPAAVVDLEARGRASLRRARSQGGGVAGEKPSRSPEPTRLVPTPSPRTTPSARTTPARGPAPALVDTVVLPLAAGSLDTIFLTFAVHEVRRLDDQRSLYRELGRVLRPGGRLVVTEHLRDAANLTVFGPGAWHFQRGSVWRSRALEAGLRCEQEESITPFVRRLVWTR